MVIISCYINTHLADPSGNRSTLSAAPRVMTIPTTTTAKALVPQIVKARDPGPRGTRLTRWFTLRVFLYKESLGWL